MPKGEHRPADVISAAIRVGRIATCDAEDKPSKAPKRAKGAKLAGQLYGEKINGLKFIHFSSSSLKSTDILKPWVAPG